MIVVTDTSPINYLVLIGEVDVLERIYGRVILPAAVLEELSSPSTPDKVGVWLANRPAWLEVSSFSPGEDSSLNHLDRGERNAIALAQHVGATRLIVDDDAARREAEKRGIPAIGVLGILVESARRGLLSLPVALASLRETSFYVSDELVEKLLAMGRARYE
jgi:predicted nucleic acid-binding protein